MWITEKWQCCRQSVCVSSMQYETTKVLGCTAGVSNTYLLVLLFLLWFLYIFDYDMYVKGGDIKAVGCSKHLGKDKFFNRIFNILHKMSLRKN